MAAVSLVPLLQFIFRQKGIIFRLFFRHVYVWNTLPESNMFLVFVVEHVTLHMLISFLDPDFEAKLSVKALAIMWVTVIG